MTKSLTLSKLAMAQTGRTIELELGRTLQVFNKYGVEYALIDTPFGVEYYGPLEDLEAWEAERREGHNA